MLIPNSRTHGNTESTIYGSAIALSETGASSG
jgi:hypothetical protein